MNEKGCFQILIFSLIGLTVVGLIILCSIIWFLPAYDLDDKNSLISIFKNFTQILFFIGTATIAVLSYFQAKKGLFNPVRTEIFKTQLEQIKQFEPLFETVNSKEDLNDHYGIEKIITANVVKQIIDYFKSEARSLRYTEQELQLNYGVKKIRKIGEKFSLMVYSEPQPEQAWKDKKIYQIYITENFEIIQSKLKELSSSSLIPTHLKEIFKKLFDEGEKVIENIGREIQNSKSSIINYVNSLDEATPINTTKLTSEIKLDENCLYCRYKEATEEIAKYLKINELISD